MKGFGHSQNSQRTYEAEILASNEEKKAEQYSTLFAEIMKTVLEFNRSRIQTEINCRMGTVRSFTHSLIQSIDRSIIHSFIHSFIHGPLILLHIFLSVGSTGAALLENNEASAKLTTANGRKFTSSSARLSSQ